MCGGCRANVSSLSRATPQDDLNTNVPDGTQDFLFPQSRMLLSLDLRLFLFLSRTSRYGEGEETEVKKEEKTDEDQYEAGLDYISISSGKNYRT